MLYGYSDECCYVAVGAVVLTYTVLLDAAMLFSRVHGVRFCL
jgi:hypothetical protein